MQRKSKTVMVLRAIPCSWEYIQRERALSISNPPFPQGLGTSEDPILVLIVDVDVVVVVVRRLNRQRRKSPLGWEPRGLPWIRGDARDVTTHCQYPLKQMKARPSTFHIARNLLPFSLPGIFPLPFTRNLILSISLFCLHHTAFFFSWACCLLRLSTTHEPTLIKSNNLWQLLMLLKLPIFLQAHFFFSAQRTIHWLDVSAFRDTLRTGWSFDFIWAFRNNIGTLLHSQFSVLEARPKE